jgi:histidinol-phosphate aminotransferase
MNVNIKHVTPYVLSERNISKGMVLLDWNENPFHPIPVIDYFKNNPFTEFNLYPDPSNKDLKAHIAEYTGVEEQYIETFNGSDSALEYIFRTLLNKGDKVLIPSPNYTQINQVITSLGANIIECGIEELEHNINDNINLIYLSNPNNPLGYVYNILPLIEKYPNIYFIVDEAYYEFAPEFTVFNKATSYSNLIVTRTFSKALCLASLRLGYLTTNLEILNNIRKIKNFKEVNKLAEIAGVVTLKNIDWYKNKIQEINTTKEIFIKSLNNTKVYNSYANFVLIEHPKIEEIIFEAKKENILIRNRSSFITNSARITIGELTDMNKLSKIINNI